MKFKISISLSILAILICLLPIPSFAVVTTKTTYETVKTAFAKTQTFDKAHLEALLGRKLSFKERLFLPVIKKNLAKGCPADKAADEAVTDGMAVAGLILGILSIPFFGFLGILGIIFSAIGLRRIKQNPEKRKGINLARAGMVCSIVGIIFWITILIFLFQLFIVL